MPTSSDMIMMMLGFLLAITYRPLFKATNRIRADAVRAHWGS
jgi:hypothetical protein